MLYEVHSRKVKGANGAGGNRALRNAKSRTVLKLAVEIVLDTPGLGCNGKEY